MYSSLTPKSRGIATLLRDPQTGRVVKVYPSLRKELLLYFPEVAEARDQGHAAEFRDALSVLYVAITRARHALHLVIPPDEGQAKSAARLVCHALGSEAPEEGAPEVIPDRGDPEWHRQLPAQVTEKAPTATRLPRDPNAPLLSPSPSGTKRNLSRRSPSSMEGGDRVDLPFLLRLDTVGALDRGEVVHAWCEAMEWIEGALPGAAVLVDQARAVAPRMDARAVAGLDAEFRGWMVREPIRAVLSRSAYPTGADVTVRVENERPFLRRKGDEIQEGFIDRLVLVEREGRVVEAHILDFKTDAIEPGDEAAVEERTRHYRPQIEAYCEMIREQYGLSAQAARGTLLFLAAERVVEVG